MSEKKPNEHFTIISDLKCDQEVFEKGEPIALLDARTKHAEPWVQKVAAHSGQRVDWHYSGGVAQVLCLGDRAKVIASIRALEPELRGTLMRIFDEPAPGLFRAGVTEAPKDAIASFYDGGDRSVFIKEVSEE